MNSPNDRTLFVGAGNMAHAIVSGAANSGVLDPNGVAVLDPDASRRRLFMKSFEDAQNAMDWLADASGDRTLVLAVKPQMLSDATQPLVEALAGMDPKPLCVSILAGTRGQSVADALEGYSGSAGLRVVRVMPNTPAQIGKGMSGVAASVNATPEDVDRVERLFGGVGDFVRIDESMMDAFTAVAGSGPAYLFYLVEAMTRGAIEVGFDEATARTLAEQTVVGASGLLESSSVDASTLRARVTSKNGTTHAATTKLDALSVMDAFGEAIVAARDRGVELGQH